jgi:RNA polymerase sigma factor (sigma-70 family)
MEHLSDSELLAEYLKNNSEAAFATLVARHVNKVYSVALRYAGNPHQAEEITQAVFVILLKKAKTLRKEAVLSGWLYHTARLTAVTFLRSEIRRVRREQEAHMETVLNQSDDNAWQQFAPFHHALRFNLPGRPTPPAIALSRPSHVLARPGRSLPMRQPLLVEIFRSGSSVAIRSEFIGCENREWLRTTVKT